MPVPLRQRVVEVEADLGDGDWRYGSGIVVRAGTVLTAAHVVQDAVAVTVRGPDKLAVSAKLDPDFVGEPDRLDLALLDIPKGADALPSIPLAAVDRDVATGDVVEGCWALGYPAFQEVRRDERGRSVRLTAQVRGFIPPLSGLGETPELLSLHVTASPEDPPAGAISESQWSGMSGAAVFSRDRLIGVVTEHAARRGPSDITVTPVDHLDGASTAPPNAPAWWERLGWQPAGLPRLPSLPARPAPPYRATLRVIRARTGLLLKRDDELSRLEAFARGSDDAFGAGTVRDGYLWLVGGPWAGKTALLAEAVHSMPPEVDVVAYFLVARESQASREQFLAAVVPQLAWLLDRDSPPVADVHVFRDFWDEAAQRASASDRQLLLVVDGLDEDLRPGGLSVAALLPTEHLGPHARVIVTSRVHTKLPGDLDGRHPLLRSSPTVLTESEQADEIRRLAEQEIGGLLSVQSTDPANAALTFHVLGLLTAAAGALSVDDLATMTGAPTWSVRDFVTRSAARSLEPLGADEDARFQFAHQTLLERCGKHPDIGGTGVYREQLHDWAAEWSRRRWPAPGMARQATPEYLLDTYATTLEDDRRRLSELGGDLAWVERAIGSAGVDRVVGVLRAVAHEPTVAAMLQLVELAAPLLRPDDQFDGPACAVAQLGWEALRLQLDGPAHDAEDRLMAYPGQQMAPVWTTEQTSPHLVRLVGRHDSGVWGLGTHAAAWVVTAAGDGLLRVWDLTEPDAAARVIGRHDGKAWGVAVDGDGHVASVGHDGAVRWWDPGRPDDAGYELGRHDGPARAVAVACGRVVSGGADGVVKSWAPAGEGAAVELGRHPSPVLAVAVADDGRAVSGGGDGAVMLWDAAGACAIGRHDGPVRGVAMRADGRVVSVGSDGTARLWDPAAPEDPGREVGRVDGALLGVAIAADDHIVAVAEDGAVRLWDATASGDPIELGRHVGRAWAVGVSGDGKLLSSGDDGAVRLWSQPRADAGVSEASISYGSLLTVALSSDGEVVCGSRDGTLQRWRSTEPHAPSSALGRHDGAVRDLVSVDGERLVSVGDDGAVRLWHANAETGSARELGRHGALAVAAAGTPDGLVVSAGHDGTLLVWDLAVANNPGTDLGRHGHSEVVLTADSDGHVISAGHDGAVRLWDPAAPGHGGRELGRQDSALLAVTAIGDGRVVTAGSDGAVRLWDRAACRELGRHDSLAVAVVAIGDRHVLSAGRDGRLLLWDIRLDGDPGRRLASVEAGIRALAVSDARDRLAVLTDRGVTVFRIGPSPW